MPGFDGQVRIRFSEPLADPRGLERAIRTSPAWRWRFEPGRSEVRLRPEDGWRDGVVWFVHVPPGVRDLLGNATGEPIELLFSTGPPVPRTLAEGRLTDRVTGRPLQGARVLFLAEDTIPYAAVSDTGGRFSLPGLPPGSYVAIGFLDLNGNLRPDRAQEPHDSARVMLDAPDATASLQLALTEPDSTPPLLASAEAADSLRLRLEFDEPLEPEPPPGAVVEVRDSTGARAWPVTRFAVGELEVAERAPGEPEAGAELEPPGAEVEEVEEGEEGEEEAGAPGERLPSRRVSVELGEPLAPGAYRVTASGFANLRGLVGGGEAGFTWTPPAREDPGPGAEEDEGDRDGDGDAGEGEPLGDPEADPEAGPEAGREDEPPAGAGGSA